MFIGEYHHTIDDKGRVIIPARFREELGATFIATKGLDHCLFLFPENEWEEIRGELRSLPFTKADSRAFLRMFFAGAAECQIDKQGRVLIQENLRRYAQLEKDLVIIGVSNRVEIWSKATWEEYSQKTEVSYEEIAEAITELDL